MMGGPTRRINPALSGLSHGGSASSILGEGTARAGMADLSPTVHHMTHPETGPAP